MTCNDVVLQQQSSAAQNVGTSTYCIDMYSQMQAKAGGIDGWKNLEAYQGSVELIWG